MALDPRITLAVLEQLVVLGNTKSISGVARELGLSQPTVSANLSRLEKTLGQALIIRGSRGTELTSAGKELADSALGLLEIAHGVNETIEGIKLNLGSLLVIAASMTVAEYLVPKWLADPRMTVAIKPGQIQLLVGNSEEVISWVTGGKADLGFIESNVSPPDCTVFSVGDDDLAIVVGRNHAWFTSTTSVTARDLISSNLLVREEGSGTRKVLEEALVKVGLALPATIPDFGSTSAILTAVQHGAAVAVVSRIAVADQIERGTLKEIDTPDLTLSRNLSAIWPIGTSLRREAASLIRGISKHSN